MEIPLDILFWAMELAYCLHCLDEAVTGIGFVEMIRKYFWPEFDKEKFFWFNAGLHLVNTAGIILYEILGGFWIIFPLSMCWLFVTNGFWHVLGTIMFREYSPGLVTSPLYWVIMYFIVRYNLLQGKIPLFYFTIAAIIGTVITILMIGSLFARRRLK